MKLKLIIKERNLKNYLKKCNDLKNCQKILTYIDECKVELRWYTAKSWVISAHSLLRVVGGKIGKVKRNIKLNLFGSKSRKGLN